MAVTTDGSITIGTVVDTEGLKKGLAVTKKQIQGIGKALAKIGVVKIFWDISKTALNAASDLTEYRNVVENTFKQSTKSFDDWYNNVTSKNGALKGAMEVFGLSELTASQIASSYQAMGNSIGLAHEAAVDMSLTLTELAGDMASFYNISQDRAKMALSAVYTGETETMKQYGILLTEVNLQQYENTNGLGRNVKTMTAAEKTLLRYNYVMDKTADAQGDFARTSKEWANQMRLLQEQWKQLLIVLGKGIKIVFNPIIIALNNMIQKVIQFANVIGDALMHIFGIQVEVKEYIGGAADAAEDLAENTEDAGKAAKKALGPYDMLNVIQKGKGSSSDDSGGSISTATKEAEGYWQKAMKDVESDIDSLFELGRKISSTLSSVLSNIDWQPIYEKARGFGTGLAEFLNGLITPDLWGQIGKTIAGGFNTISATLLSFAETLDWGVIGLSIGERINQFFNTFDAKQFGSAIGKFVGGIVHMIGVAFVETDWDNVFTNIVEFVTSLISGFVEKVELKDVGIAILSWSVTSGSIVSFGKFVTSTLIPSLLSSIGGLGEILIPELAINIGSFTFIPSMGTVALGGIGAIVGLVAGLKEAYDTSELIRQSFSSAVASLKDGFLSVVSIFVNDMLPSIVEGTKNVLDIFTPLGSLLDTIFNDLWTHVINPAIAFTGEELLPGLAQTLALLQKDAIEPLTDLLKVVFKPVVEVVTDVLKVLWTNVLVPLVDVVGSALGAAFKIIVALLRNPVMPVIKFLIQVITTVVDMFMTVVKTLVDIVGPIFTTIFETIGGVVTGFSKVLKGLGDFISGVFTGNWRKAWNGIKTIFKGVWQSFTSIVKAPINAIIGIINGLLKGITNAVNFMIRALNRFQIDIPSWVPEVGGQKFGFSFSEVEPLSIPKLAQGAVIPPNKEFMAILGDQKNGTNIETPLDTMVQAFKTALTDMGGTNSGDIIIQIDGETVFKAVRKQAERYSRQTGNPAYI